MNHGFDQMMRYIYLCTTFCFRILRPEGAIVLQLCREEPGGIPNCCPVLLCFLMWQFLLCSLVWSMSLFTYRYRYTCVFTFEIISRLILSPEFCSLWGKLWVWEVSEMNSYVNQIEDRDWDNNANGEAFLPCQKHVLQVFLLFHQNSFLSKFFSIKILFHQNSFSSKSFLIKIHFHQNSFSSKFFFIKILFHQNLFSSKFFFIQILFDQNSFSSKFLSYLVNV